MGGNQLNYNSTLQWSPNLTISVLMKRTLSSRADKSFYCYSAQYREIGFEQNNVHRPPCLLLVSISSTKIVAGYLIAPQSALIKL